MSIASAFSCRTPLLESSPATADRLLALRDELPDPLLGKEKDGLRLCVRGLVMALLLL